MRETPSAIACNPCRDSEDERIVVLGIGNVLWADEGFGVRCVEALQALWDFAPHVQLIDGGTQGLYLIPQVTAARRLLILDAVDYGLAPGTLKLVENDQVPRFLGAKKMSLHQTGFQEVLALAQMTDSFPDEVLLIGCQPEQLEDYGGSLRPCVKAALDAAVPIALERLARQRGLVEGAVLIHRCRALSRRGGQVRPFESREMPAGRLRPLTIRTLQRRDPDHTKAQADAFRCPKTCIHVIPKVA